MRPDEAASVQQAAAVIAAWSRDDSEALDLLLFDNIEVKAQQTADGLVRLGIATGAVIGKQPTVGSARCSTR